MLLLRCAVPSRRDFQKRPLAMLLTHVAFPKHWRKLNLVLNNQQKQTSRRQTTPRCENVTSYFQQDETRPDEFAEGSDIRDEAAGNSPSGTSAVAIHAGVELGDSVQGLLESQGDGAVTSMIRRRLSGP
jgi:hypothetical protein